MGFSLVIFKYPRRVGPRVGALAVHLPRDGEDREGVGRPTGHRVRGEGPRDPVRDVGAGHGRAVLPPDAVTQGERPRPEGFRMVLR